MELTLRNALEPWHVMGEESTAGGTARYVDSSLERIEVRVTGLNESRYVITCNGQALPLQSTGTTGDYVAGVRYRAWNPPSALHPTIGVHAPLMFDIVDTWTKRSLGGCQLPRHPPGRPSYDTLPGQRLRGRKPAHGAVLAPWATRRARWTCRLRTINVPGSRSSRSRKTCGADLDAPHGRPLCVWPVCDSGTAESRHRHTAAHPRSRSDASRRVM